MKTLIVYLVLALMAGTAHAQEVTELKEAKIGFTPLKSKVERDGHRYTFKIQKSHAREFAKDPLAYVENYFDIQNFISEVGGENYNSYLVSFKSKKGQLTADFNRNGELLKSTSVFKNTILPKELKEKLYSDHKGWIMVENVHITRGKKGLVVKDFYKIKVVNGKERKNLIFEAPQRDLRVVSK